MLDCGMNICRCIKMSITIQVWTHLSWKKRIEENKFYLLSRGVKFFQLCDRISRQNQNQIRKYFSLFIRADGIESRKKWRSKISWNCLTILVSAVWVYHYTVFIFFLPSLLSISIYLSYVLSISENTADNLKSILI